MKNAEKIRERDAEAKRTQRKADPEGNRKRMEAYCARQEKLKEEIAGRPRANQCDICGSDGKTVFDHDHANGKFRGWICDRCNKVLGLVKDSPALLQEMAGYLEVLDGEAEGKTEKRASGI